MKQTGVEYLASYFDEYGIDYGLLQPIIKKAKELEIENIKEAFCTGRDFSEDYFIPNSNNSESQEYYNQTFKP